MASPLTLWAVSPPCMPSAPWPSPLCTHVYGGPLAHPGAPFLWSASSMASCEFWGSSPCHLQLEARICTARQSPQQRGDSLPALCLVSSQIPSPMGLRSAGARQDSVGAVAPAAFVNHVDWCVRATAVGGHLGSGHWLLWPHHTAGVPVTPALFAVCSQ